MMKNKLSIALVSALSILLVAHPLIALAQNLSDGNLSDGGVGIIDNDDDDDDDDDDVGTTGGGGDDDDVGTIPIPPPPITPPPITPPPITTPPITPPPLPPNNNNNNGNNNNNNGNSNNNNEDNTTTNNNQPGQGNLTTPEENLPLEPAPSTAVVNGDAAKPEPTAAPELPRESIAEPTQEPGGETVETTTTSGGESNNDGGENAPQPISIEAPPPDVEIGFTPTQQEAVNQVAEGITGSGPIPGDSVTASAAGISGGGDGGPLGVQGILLTVLTGTGQISPNNSLIRILGEGEASQSLVLKLAQSLLGLLQGNKVDPKRLLAAVAAYNALVKASSAEFLQNPPPELITIRAVLSELVNAAQSAQGQGGQSN